MRAAKRDTNHAEIRDALRAIPGVHVHDAGGYAGAGFDLIAVYQERRVAFLEVKPHAKAKLTDSERAAKKRLAPFWYRIESFEDALQALGISTEVAPF